MNERLTDLALWLAAALLTATAALAYRIVFTWARGVALDERGAHWRAANG